MWSTQYIMFIVESCDKPFNGSAISMVIVWILRTLQIGTLQLSQIKWIVKSNDTFKLTQIKVIGLTRSVVVKVLIKVELAPTS